MSDEQFFFIGLGMLLISVLVSKVKRKDIIILLFEIMMLAGGITFMLIPLIVSIME